MDLALSRNWIYKYLFLIFTITFSRGTIPLTRICWRAESHCTQSLYDATWMRAVDKLWNCENLQISLNQKCAKLAISVLLSSSFLVHITVANLSNSMLYVISASIFLLRCSTIGWVNFSEFEITVCGSCKISQKN